MKWIKAPHLVLAGLAALAAAVGAVDRYRCHSEKGYEITITYWEKWSGFELEAMRDTVKAFNESQDEIYAHFVPTSQVDQKTMIFTAGGQPPDVAGLWAANVAPFAEQGALMPLDEFIEKDEQEDRLNLDDYVPNYLETCKYRDRLWALPTVPATVGLFYNRRLFREAGLPDRAPRTIAELDEFARKIDRWDEHGNLVRIGFLHTEPGWWKWAWGYYFGGRMTDGKGNVLPEPKPWIEAFEWADLYAKRLGRTAVVGVQNGFGQFDSPQNAFISERVAMVIQGVWMPNFISRYNRGLEYGVAPFPTKVYDPDHPVTQVETDVIAMPKGCPHPGAAWKFMKFVAGHRGAGIVCTGQGKDMALRELPREYVAKNPNPHIERFHKLAFSEKAYICGRFPILEEFRREMRVAFDQVWQGKKTPQKAVEDARRRLQQALDRVIERTDYIPPAQ